MNGRSPKHVVILLPQTWGIRNLITSGVVQALRDRGIRVTLLLRRLKGWRESSIVVSGVDAVELLQPRKRARVPGRNWLGAVLHTAFDRKYKLHRDRRFWEEYLSQMGGRTFSPPSAIQTSLGIILQPFAFRYLLRRLREEMYRWEFDLEPIKRQLKELQPDLLLSTVCVDHLEYPYVLAAGRLGIRTTAAILSFDNLTTRQELPLFDRYAVWGERMRDEVLRYYPTAKTEHVTITGTPQFDFHLLPRFQWTRQETLKRLGLPNGSRYLLYGANAAFFTPTEPELVLELSRRLREEPGLEDLCVVIRLHPLDEFERWRHLHKVNSKVVISLPWVTKRDPDNWALVGAEDQALLVSSLAHAELCVNMCSTLSLDAAVLDKPVVGIAFALTPGTMEDTFSRIAYASPHYRPIAESEGISLAQTMDEAVRFIRWNIDYPDANSANRKRLVDSQCGLVDGHSHTRLEMEIIDSL